MKNKEITELIQLYVVGEADEDEKIFVENAMLESNELREEYETIKKMYDAFSESRPAPISDRQVDKARTELMRSIRAEAHKASTIDKITEVIKDFLFGNYRLAFSSTATLIVGIFLGYFLFAKGPVENQMFNGNKMVDVDKIDESDLQISNIRLKSPFSDEGQIEFSFDAVKPISYTGNADDEFTRRLLAQALLTADNPGVRLKTVNTIAQQSRRNFIPDQKVKSALITTLKIDDNPGVRREALNVLLNYSLDDEIRDAFLFVLQNDKNSGMRVAAINALGDWKDQGRSIDNEIRNVLNKKVETDQNDFIRIRAASLLKEIN
ncbi:MAG: HEAT repeat domain-containing protein [bacterium]